MKRDLEVVKRILLELEARPAGATDEMVELEGVSPEVTAEHVRLLCQAGLMEANDVTSMGDSFPQFISPQLTWNGHEFLDSIRNDTVMGLVREKAGAQFGSLPFEVIKELATAVIRSMSGL